MMEHHDPRQPRYYPSELAELLALQEASLSWSGHQFAQSVVPKYVTDRELLSKYMPMIPVGPYPTTYRKQPPPQPHTPSLRRDNSSPTHNQPSPKRSYLLPERAQQLALHRLTATPMERVDSGMDIPIVDMTFPTSSPLNNTISPPRDPTAPPDPFQIYRRLPKAHAARHPYHGPNLYPGFNGHDHLDLSTITPEQFAQAVMDKRERLERIADGEDSEADTVYVVVAKEKRGGKQEAKTPGTKRKRGRPVGSKARNTRPRTTLQE